jgi:hypothetical protein
VMNVDIPNWPLVSIKNIRLSQILIYFFFSFFKTERKLYHYRGFQTLFLE